MKRIFTMKDVVRRREDKRFINLVKKCRKEGIKRFSIHILEINLTAVKMYDKLILNTVNNE